MEDDRLLGEHHHEHTRDNDEDDKFQQVDERVDAFKIAILLCISLMTFGSYWVYDIPGAIETQLMTWFGPSYTRESNAVLYTVYSIPNVILAFFGGFLVDKFGIRFGATLFCGLVFVGQTIFALGVQFKVYWVCVLGRFIFGLGGESLTVAQNTFTAKWFAGKNIAVFFGVVVSVSRIGSSINFAVTPQLTNYVPTALWVGTATTVISMLACMAAIFLDYKGRHRVKKDVSADEKINLLFARTFPLSAWIIFFICVFFYVAVLTFYTVASNILQTIGGYSPDKASFFIFIPNFVSIFASPAFGYLVDKKGFSLLWIFEAACMLVLAHLGFVINATGAVQIPPVALFIWLGFAYSLGCAAMWPMLQYIIEPKALGTAYGIMTSMQNAGLALFPVIINAINASTESATYTFQLLVFVASAAIAAAFTLFLFGVDARRHNGILNASAEKRKEILTGQSENSIN